MSATARGGTKTKPGLADLLPATGEATLCRVRLARRQNPDNYKAALDLAFSLMTPEQLRHFASYWEAEFQDRLLPRRPLRDPESFAKNEDDGIED